MYENLINNLKASREEQHSAERRLFMSIVRDYMKAHNTRSISFDEDDDCPSLEYNGMLDGDIADATVTTIRFNEDGSINNIDCHLYYEQMRPTECSVDEFIVIDYLDLAEYIAANI